MADPRKHEMEFTDDQIKEYDWHVDYYYSNLIESIILYTYDEKGLDGLHEILGDPITELYEELDYAYTPVLIETVFANNKVDAAHRNEVFSFKKRVDEIPTEIWKLEELDTNPTWLKIRSGANKLLDVLGIESRTYEANYTAIYNGGGMIVYEGPQRRKS